MHKPQQLAAVLLSAAFLCTTGIALADKGGNHDKHGGSSAHGPSAPGQSSSGSDSKAASQRGPGGIGGPRSTPGDFDRSEFTGSAGDRDVFRAGAKAAIHVKFSNGSTHDFDISSAALNSLKSHQGRGDLIFFTNGQQITAVCNRGEKDNMRVTARTGDTFMLQDQSGQTRLITLDSKTASRLHVKVGSNLQVTAMTATSGRVVALDLMKKHDFDKFARGSKTDVDINKIDVDQVKADIDTPKYRNAKKADVDAVKLDIDIVKADLDNPKTRKSKKLDFDLAKLDVDKQKLDTDVAKLDIDTKKAKKAKKTDVDVDVAKTDIDTGKGHKAKNRKTDVDVADVDVKGNGMGKCGHGSSRSGNPAFANQMAKDAANDASGHNPPGLPHECVNPAGHTRGFCKSSSSEGICGGGSSSGGGVSSDLHGGIANRAVPGSGAAPAPGSGLAPGRGYTTSGSGTRGPGAPVGMIPAGGGTFASGSSSGTRGAAGAPTHVLGASTGPTSGRRIAALPTRVLPVAIQPVGKRRCVWYKTGVLGASTGGHYVVGTSAVNGKPVLHKKCR